MPRGTAVTGLLMGNSKKGKLKKPSLSVNVYSHAPGDGMNAPDESKWMKEDLKRERDQIKRYEQILETWVPEEVAAQAKADVEMKLSECKLRVKDIRARMKLRAKEDK